MTPFARWWYQFRGPTIRLFGFPTLPVFILLSVLWSDPFGTQPASQWELWAGLFGLLFAYAVGHLTIRDLPLFLSHGMTRHQIMSAARQFGIAYAGAAAIVVAVGMLLEGAFHPWAPVFDQLPGSPSPNLLLFVDFWLTSSQFWLVFVEYWLLFVVAASTGALIAAGDYRKSVQRRLSGLVGVVIVVLAANAVGTPLPFAHGFGFSRPVPVALAICVAAVGMGSAMTWAIVRDVPIGSGTA